MENQVLSIEQMNTLIGLGIDTSKASMLWMPNLKLDKEGNPFVSNYFVTVKYIDNNSLFWDTEEGKLTIPTFTLHDILDMLPTTIKWVDENDENNWVIYSFVLTKSIIGYYFEGEDDHFVMSYFIQDGNLLNAAFKLLKWCKQNNYI